MRIECVERESGKKIVRSETELENLPQNLIEFNLGAKPRRRVA